VGGTWRLAADAVISVPIDASDARTLELILTGGQRTGSTHTCGVWKAVTLSPGLAAYGIIIRTVAWAARTLPRVLTIGQVTGGAHICGVQAVTLGPRCGRRRGLDRLAIV